jgi:hypothetical protein
MIDNLARWEHIFTTRIIIKTLQITIMKTLKIVLPAGDYLGQAETDRLTKCGDRIVKTGLAPIFLCAAGRVVQQKV